VRIETIQESWETFLGRLELVGSRSVRWGWLAIKEQDAWQPYAITVRVSEAETPPRSLKSDASNVWIATSLISVEEAASRLDSHRVGEPLVQGFDTQDSYSAQWVQPGSEYWAVTANGWPVYHVTWPMGRAANLTYLVSWYAPFRSGSIYYPSIAEACAVLLFGRKSMSHTGNNIPSGITMQLPYPYRIAAVDWRDDCVHVDIDWSGAREHSGLSIAASWRASSGQIEPDSDTIDVPERGGSVAIAVGSRPAEVDVSLNDPLVPVPCQEWHWPEAQSTPMTVHLDPVEEETASASSPAIQLANVDFTRLINDSNLASVLQARWGEVRKCLGARANLAALVVAGSVLEGALLGLARDRSSTVKSAKAAPKGRDGSTLAVEEWRFNTLVQVATELEWFPKSMSAYANVVRSLRNYVHPWEERLNADPPTDGVTRISVTAIEEILNHLIQSPPSQ
jgi:hypothetical protein